MEHQIANLQFRVNHQGILGEFMEIRLLQSQIDEWLPNNILNKWRYNNSVAFRNDLTAKILCAANNFGLGFKTNNLLELNMNGILPIQDILPDEYRKIKDQLRKRDLIFIDQLISNNSTLFTWEQLNNMLNFTSKGKIPKW